MTMTRGITGLTVLIAVVAGMACGTQEPHRPNVLLISIDTLRLDRLTSYGGEEGTSPHIDALAAAGVRFSSVQAARGLTWPSLTTLLTGLEPRTHEVRLNGAQLDERFPILPEILSARGYATGGFLSNMCDAPNRGLDTFFCSWWEASGPPIAQKRQQWMSHEQPQWDAAITREALEFITTQRDEPFFAWVHYIDPHKPFDLVEEYARPEVDGSFAVDDDSLASLTLAGTPPTAAQMEQLLAIYDSQVAATDAHIGTLLAGLAEAGLADDTLVIFTADHGEELGDHHAYFYHLSSIYQQVLAIPLILRWPGNFPAGVVVDEPIAGVDIAPTILDALGLSADVEMEGDSRVSLARREPGATGARHTYSEWSDHLLVVGQENWRYVWNPNNVITFGAPFQRESGRGFTIAAEELYDLSRDPRQMENIVADHPEQAAALRLEACRFVQERDFHGKAPRPITSEARKRLESLGYLQGEDETADVLLRLREHCPESP
jgi:arylsulfatase